MFGKRREKVEEIGQAIIKSLKEIQLVHQSGDLNSTHLDACYHSLRKDYDPEFGGFGNKPKFPTSHTLSFLLRYFKRTGETHALNMVKNTLKKSEAEESTTKLGLVFTAIPPTRNG